MSAFSRLTGKGVFRGRAAGKPRSRAFTLTVGFAVVALAVAMFYVGYEAPNAIPGRSYYTLYAQMTNADNLEGHYQVRIGGELAGQVLNPTVYNHYARVELQLSSAYKPLLSDTLVAIRLRSAFGIRYVQLIPGRHGTPLPDGATIPASQASSLVDLDQVLDTFDPNTRLRTQQFLGELGTGLLGRGLDVQRLLRQAPGFIEQLGSVSAAINSRPQAMRQLISATQGTTAAFDPVRGNLANGFQPEAQALQPFASQATSVQATLDQAPPTLAELQTGLPPVTAMVAQLQGFATAATPTLTAAPGALNQTTALLNDAQPGLRNADATLHLAQRAVSPTLTFLQTAQPALPQINSAIADVQPTVQHVAPRACGLSDALSGWADVLRWGTPYQNYIQFTLTETSTIVAGTPNAPVLTNPYPGPCVGAVGEAGGPRPTPEQQQRTTP
jgi:ABC-type transporter Mla subunit MlaD